MQTDAARLGSWELPAEMKALLQDNERILLHAECIRANGYTLLPNALPAGFVEEMRSRFDELMEEYRRETPFNRGANRFQMYLPFEPPFSHPLLYQHPVALAVVRAVLGERILLGYLASDTPLPGSEYQRVHPDSEALFPETGIQQPSFALVVNTPLVDVTEENGPLEIWPGGTHMFSTRAEVEKLAAALPSERLVMKSGSLLIRDPRTWHRGTPNRSDRSRPNVALVYTRHWYRFAQEPPRVARSVYGALDESGKSLLRHAVMLEQ